MALGGMLLLTAGIVLGYMCRGWLDARHSTAAENDGVRSPRVQVSADKGPALGPQDPRVSLIEFSDQECPYRRLWDQPVRGKLVSAYGGKIRFACRDLTLQELHPEVEPGAIAPDCAGEQGKYRERHDLLIEARQGVGEAAGSI